MSQGRLPVCRLWDSWIFDWGGHVYVAEQHCMRWRFYKLNNSSRAECPSVPLHLSPCAIQFQFLRSDVQFINEFPMICRIGPTFVAVDSCTSASAWEHRFPGLPRVSIHSRAGFFAGILVCVPFLLFVFEFLWFDSNTKAAAACCRYMVRRGLRMRSREALGLSWWVLRGWWGVWVTQNAASPQETLQRSSNRGTDHVLPNSKVL